MYNLTCKVSLQNVAFCDVAGNCDLQSDNRKSHIQMVFRQYVASNAFLASIFWHIGDCKHYKYRVSKNRNENSLHHSVDEVISKSYLPIYCEQLGHASSNILNPQKTYHKRGTAFWQTNSVLRFWTYPNESQHGSSIVPIV